MPDLCLDPDPYIGILNNILQFQENCWNVQTGRKQPEKSEFRIQSKKVRNCLLKMISRVSISNFDFCLGNEIRAQASNHHLMTSTSISRDMIFLQYPVLNMVVFPYDYIIDFHSCHIWNGEEWRERIVDPFWLWTPESLVNRHSVSFRLLFRSSS